MIPQEPRIFFCGKKDNVRPGPGIIPRPDCTDRCMVGAGKIQNTKKHVKVNRMAGQSWIFVKASWKGGTTFVVENRAGCREIIAAREPAGAQSRHFSPIDAFIASLAACAGTNVVLLLLDRGIAVRSFTVKAECILNAAEPRSFEKIHLHFLLGGEMDEGIAADAITRSMTLVCPIAVTVGKAADVTWELHIAHKAGK